MEHSTQGTRGETTQPPPGHEVIRTQDRYFLVRLHPEHPDAPGINAFTRPDGQIVSCVNRASAMLSLSQHQRNQAMLHASPRESESYAD